MRSSPGQGHRWVTDLACATIRTMSRRIEARNTAGGRLVARRSQKRGEWGGDRRARLLVDRLVRVAERAAPEHAWSSTEEGRIRDVYCVVRRSLRERKSVVDYVMDVAATAAVGTAESVVSKKGAPLRGGFGRRDGPASSVESRTPWMPCRG